MMVFLMFLSLLFVFYNLGDDVVFCFVNIVLLEQKEIKQVAAISTLQKITLSLKLFFYGYFVVLVSFPYFLLYHYSLCARSYRILSSASVNRNYIIKSQAAAYPFYTFTAALAP